MALATVAAYETVSSDFHIDTLHTHFLLGPKADQQLDARVSRLSDSGKFATRVIILEQNDKSMVHVTCTFVKTSAMVGPSMTHSMKRASSKTLDAITLDDLAPGATSAGPVMKYQRFPLEYTGRGSTPDKSSPEHWTYTCAASINTPIDPTNKRLHALGIIHGDGEKQHPPSACGHFLPSALVARLHLAGSSIMHSRSSAPAQQRNCKPQVRSPT